MTEIMSLCKNAKDASRPLALIGSRNKDAALEKLSNWLRKSADEIVFENQRDIQDGINNGLSAAMVDRLTLTPERIHSIAEDLNHVIHLPNPVGEVFEEQVLPNGLKIHKQRIPLGVIAVIYESRPNVTVDVASLALKSGNAVILRGGSETLNSNRILVKGIHQSLEKVGIDPGVVQFIDDPSRNLVSQLLKMHPYVDMLIPRGGASLHAYCRENSTIPVITGGIGVCHLFVDESADLEKSIEVIRNAKIQRPTVCNALDTVLVHQAIANEFIPHLISELRKDGVSFRVDPQSIRDFNISTSDEIQQAEAGDFDKEWLSLVLGIRSVPDLDEALRHIAIHSTGHSDGILTENQKHAERFKNEVDSSVVYVNASTRFTDGGQLGLGAEVAISTQRLHARGPMALRELTTYKWVVEGEYQIRDC